MGVLEQVVQMKKEGVPEEQIITYLREQGVSPKHINDALSQSQIKDAVSNQETMAMEKSIAPSQKFETPMPSEESHPSQGFYTPRTQETANGTFIESQEQQQGQYQQEAYQPAENYGYEEAFGTDTIIEISEQVFSEHMKTLQKQFSELKEFKTMTEVKLEHALERLKKIENIIDKLQLAILDKIGSYGDSLESIKKEMTMIEDTFTKTSHTTHPAHTQIKHSASHSSHPAHKTHPAKHKKKRKKHSKKR